MKVIRRRIHVFAALTGFGILTAIMLLTLMEAKHDTEAQILIVLVIIGSSILAGFWIREFRKLKIARLIVESPILHISTYIISDISSEAEQLEDIENTEVFISYFGILLETKIIKFNQNGIQLKAVEIGPDFLSFTYGKGKRVKNIKILRPFIDLAASDEFAQKLHYETGIMPTFIS